MSGTVLRKDILTVAAVVCHSRNSTTLDADTRAVANNLNGGIDAYWRAPRTASERRDNTCGAPAGHLLARVPAYTSSGPLSEWHGRDTAATWGDAAALNRLEATVQCSAACTGQRRPRAGRDTDHVTWWSYR